MPRSTEGISAAAEVMLREREAALQSCYGDGRDIGELTQIIKEHKASFIEVATALAEVRDRRLFEAEGFETFEKYCARMPGLKKALVLIQKPVM